MFASDYNTKHVRFNSKWLCHGTEAIDGIAQDWCGEINWLVPPVSLLILVIKKIVSDKATGILVCPVWKSAKFWSYFDGLRQNDDFETDCINLPRIRVTKGAEETIKCLAKTSWISICVPVISIIKVMYT